MIALLIVLIVLASVAAYLAVGVTACRYTVPRGIERTYEHDRKCYSSMGEDTLREWALVDGTGWRLGTTLFWPVAVPATFIMSGRVMRSTESYAPWAKEAKIEEREKRITEREREIAKLERELGIRKYVNEGER